MPSPYEQCKLDMDKLKQIDLEKLRLRANFLLSTKQRLAYIEILRSGSGRSIHTTDEASCCNERHIEHGGNLRSLQLRVVLAPISLALRSLVDFTAVVGVVLVCDAHKCCYCYYYVGTLAVLMSRFGGLENALYHYNSPLDALTATQRDYFRFTFVKDPTSRFYSTYRLAAGLIDAQVFYGCKLDCSTCVEGTYQTTIIIHSGVSRQPKQRKHLSYSLGMFW